MTREFITCTILALSLQATAQDILRGEYWIDTDPGFGLATPLDPALIAAPNIVEASIIIPPDSLGQGFHVIGFRTQDANWRWSHTNLRAVFVTDSSNGTIIRAEYFWGSDPGFGNGDVIPNWVPGMDLDSLHYQVNVPAGLGPLVDTLYVRTLDSRGRWSHTNHVDTIDVSGVDVADLPRASGVQVYPNPFAETITVQPSEVKPLRVILYDPNGKLVYDRVLTSATNVDLSGMTSGAYTAFFWQDQERIHRTTLIKQ